MILNALKTAELAKFARQYADNMPQSGNLATLIHALVDRLERVPAIHAHTAQMDLDPALPLRVIERRGKDI